MADALGTFAGTGRRFEKRGEPRGVEVVDDYAHHPTEVEALLSAAREVADARGGLLLRQYAGQILVKPGLDLRLGGLQPCRQGGRCVFCRRGV